jgi:hypothetical protein
MTALTTPRRPDEDDTCPRPIPWRRMAGVTWRQHRVALVAVTVLLGALAVYLWIAGLSLNHAYAAAVGCQPASSAACQGLDSTLDGMDNFLSNGFVLQVLPVLIGAFVGAPVLARELEGHQPVVGQGRPVRLRQLSTEQHPQPVLRAPSSRDREGR